MLLLLLLSLFKLQVQNETRRNDRSFALKVKKLFQSFVTKMFFLVGEYEEGKGFLFFDFKFII